MSASEMECEDSPLAHGQAGAFATTHWSVVLAAGQSDAPEVSDALETLCRSYWHPVYAFLLRSGHNKDDAKDLTQGFFLRLLERNDFSTIRPEKGRFRSFLLSSLKHFLINERFRACAQKRGGGRAPIPLDEILREGCHRLEPADHGSPERIFDRRWAMALFDRVLARLRDEYIASGRERQFECLKGYLSENDPGIAQSEVGRQLGLTTGSVKVSVHRLRRRYRALLQEQVAHTVANESDVAEELRDLIAALRS